MASPLAAFLSWTRAVCLRGSSTTIPFTIVLGNPSADLDSLISAVVYAYCHTTFSTKGTSSPRLFLPILNLPTTPASDLWRLRPEFGTALKWAADPYVGQDSHSTFGDEDTKGLLKQLVTIADLRSAAKSTPVSLFSESEVQGNKDDYVLVDHNAPSIPTLTMEDLNRHVNITGCIDHHEDESSVPPGASPRIIQMGIGSCASLVVLHLRDSHLWPESGIGPGMGQLARLALAPILIDTANLTAKGKVSDTDRDAVAFLESCILSNRTFCGSPGHWSPNDFYKDIATTKANSLDLLTLPEIFDRDYKEWTESTKSGDQLKIGISSVVKPITWLLRGTDEFLKQLCSFVQDSEHDLALYGIMTTSVSEGGEFQRELAVFAFTDTACKALEAFEAKTTEQLDLGSWDVSPELLTRLDLRFKDSGRSSRVWWQRDVAKSRKQVAPLLRAVVKDC